MAIIEREDGTPLAETVEDLKQLVANTPRTPKGFDVTIAEIGMAIEEQLQKDFPEPQYDGALSVGIQADRLKYAVMADGTRLDGLGVEASVIYQNEVLKIYHYFVEVDENDKVVRWDAVNVEKIQGPTHH